MTEIKRRTGLERAIFELGGVSALADILGVHRNTVRHWRQKNYVPATMQTKMLELARANGIELKAEDLIG